MKVRLLTLLAVIFLLGNVSSAQGVGTFRAKKKSTIVKKNLAPQRQGFYVMPEVGVGIELDDIDFNFNLQAVFGYEFNNHFAIGVGTGFNNFVMEKYAYTSEALSVSIPLYLNIHGDFSKHKTTAYYSLDLGVQMPIKRALGYVYYYDYGYHSDSRNSEYFYKGFFISPEIGIRFNRCYLGVNFTYTTIYMYKVALHIVSSYILDLKFGYKIPLKNVRF